MGLYTPKNYDVKKYAIQKNFVDKFEPISTGYGEGIKRT
jgi:hypothetical protein